MQSVLSVNAQLDAIHRHLLDLLKHGVPTKKAADNLGSGLDATPRKPGKSGLKPGQVPPWVDPWVGVGASPFEHLPPGWLDEHPPGSTGNGG